MCALSGLITNPVWWDPWRGPGTEQRRLCYVFLFTKSLWLKKNCCDVCKIKMIGMLLVNLLHWKRKLRVQKCQKHVTEGDAWYTKSTYALLSRSIVWSLLCYCVRARDHCCVLCDITWDLLFTWYMVHQPHREEYPSSEPHSLGSLLPIPTEHERERETLVGSGHVAPEQN